MNNKQSVFNIIIGSIALGLTNAYLYTFDGLPFFSAFAGYTVLAFVVMLFLISFIPSRREKPKKTEEVYKQKKTKNLKKKDKASNKPQPVAAVARSTEDEDGDRLSGQIKWYDPRKGFGFLVHGDQEIFFHRHAIRTRHHHFQENDPVYFCLGESDKGPQATAVWFDKNEV